MIFHNVEQGTDEWKKKKAGLVSMSNLKFIMANFPAAFGNPGKKYAHKIAVEQLTGNYIEDGYFNEHMGRGHIDEPISVALYESEFFVAVQRGGFYSSDIFGYSPDGGIDFQNGKHKGVIETKSRDYSSHLDNVRRGSFEPESKWQCIGALKCGGFDWLDFISYCGDFPPGKQIYVFRMFPDMFRTEFEQIDQRVEQFLKLVSETKETILNARYL